MNILKQKVKGQGQLCVASNRRLGHCTVMQLTAISCYEPCYHMMYGLSSNEILLTDALLPL